MRRGAWIAIVFGCVATCLAVETAPVFLFPRIKGHGGIAPIPDAAEPPRPGVKIVFDITADGEPEKPNKGLESVARYLNLHASAGLKPEEVRVAFVLHGGATKAALADEAYAANAKTVGNPNLGLIGELKAAGVEAFVCGQSLARNGYPTSSVASDVAIAASAMTVVVNRQQDGYALFVVH